MIIIVEFQFYSRKVIVLAVSREWCVFHVDNMHVDVHKEEGGKAHVDRGGE